LGGSEGQTFYVVLGDFLDEL